LLLDTPAVVDVDVVVVAGGEHRRRGVALGERGSAAQHDHPADQAGQDKSRLLHEISSVTSRLLAVSGSGRSPRAPEPTNAAILGLTCTNADLEGMLGLLSVIWFPLGLRFRRRSDASPLSSQPPLRQHRARSGKAAAPAGELPRPGPHKRSHGPFSRVRAQVSALEPAHHRTELGARLLDRVGRQLLAGALELLLAAVELLDQLAGEPAVLDLGEDLAHRPAGLLGDDPGAARVAAVLGGVGHRPVHLRDAALVHEVDDELHLVQALEVGHLGLVARLDQGLEPGLDQLGDAAAEHGLLTEQVGLGLLGEGGLERAGAGAADALRVRERQVEGPAGGVLLHGDQAGHAAPGLELTAHQVAGALRGHHAHVDALGRLDEAVADVEPVAEEERVALLEVGRDVVGVQVALDVVRRQDHDEVGLLDRLARGQHPQAVALGLLPALGALGQADPDVDAGVTQGERVGVALAAVPQHGHTAPLDDRQVGLVVVEDLGHLRKTFQAVRSSALRDRSVMERAPRPMATMPDWTSSLIPNGSSTLTKASSLSGVPVHSMVTASAATSTQRARKSWTSSSTWERLSASALTLISVSSRCTDWDGSSSTILSTFTSLLSCLVTCSSGSLSTLTTIVMREMSSCSVGPTASESMLKPRRLNSAATRASTPGLFSTSTDSVCLGIPRSPT